MKNLSERVKIDDYTLKIYCDECESWRSVALHSRSNVVFRQDGIREIRDRDQEFACCPVCYVNVDYLLSPAQQQLVRKNL